MARNPPTYPVGDRLPGTKYVVVDALGHGGMGFVLKVVKEPGIKAVVKIIHPHLAKRPEFVARFFDEVRILAQLQHPNIVNVIDYDKLEDGTPFYAMELLTGKTVRELLRDVGTVQPAIAFEITHQLLEGLYHAHTHQPCVVHRDVKAENVFLHSPPFGAPCIKVIDFGVAALEGIKEEGAFLGTPKYAPPEQLRGETVTPKADLYAAGLILYEMLAGRGPFDQYGDSDRIVKAHLSEAAPPIRQFAPWVPESIEKLLGSALAKDPNQRPRDAYAFAAKLFDLQFLGDRPASVNTTAPTLSTMLTATSAPSPEALLEGLHGTATDRRMTPPWVSGHTLEDAPHALEEHPTYSGRFAPPVSSTPDRERPTATLSHAHDGLTVREPQSTTAPMPGAPQRSPIAAAQRQPVATASRHTVVMPPSSEHPRNRAPSSPVIESETGIARSVPLKIAPSTTLARRASRRLLRLVALPLGVVSLCAVWLIGQPTNVAVARSGPATALVEVLRTLPAPATSLDAPPSSSPAPSATPSTVVLSAATTVAAIPAPARPSSTPRDFKPTFAPKPPTKPAKDDGANLLFEAP